MSAPRKVDTWMPLYVADYLKDTMSLTTELHGAYLLLLMACWTNGGRLRNDPLELAGAAKMTPQAWKRAAPIILRYFIDEGETLTHKRVLQEFEKAQRLSEVRRETGSKGGRPRKQSESNGKPIGSANRNLTGSQTETPSPISEASASENHRSDAYASSLTGERERPSARKSDEPIPEVFPTAEDVAEAEGWIREAGVTLSAADHARRFRNHARTNDRRVASWPDAWRMWIEIEIGKAPKASASKPAAKPPEAWTGPPEIARAVEFCMGVYAATYLGQCVWQDVPEKALTTTSRVAYDRIRRDAGADLSRMGVKVILSEGRAA